jgi:hypothetical protein
MYIFSTKITVSEIIINEIFFFAKISLKKIIIRTSLRFKGMFEKVIIRSKISIIARKVHI